MHLWIIIFPYNRQIDSALPKEQTACTVTAYTIRYGVTVYTVYFGSILCSQLLCTCLGINLFKFSPSVCKVSKYQEFLKMSFCVRQSC